MAKGNTQRFDNGVAFFPKWIWDHIKVEKGDEIEFEDHTRKDGKKSIRFWKKGQ
jgi:hypothetical protein